jgi:rod shape determining protein RodA
MRYSPLSTNNQEKIDSLAVFLYVVLLLIGFISVSSATSDVNQAFYSLSDIAIKQLVFIFGAILIIFTIVFSNVVVIDYFAYGFYAIAITLNILVLFLGREISGAKSWFGFGGFGIQPSEFAKVATALALSKFLGTYGVKFQGTKNIVKALGIVLLPMAIILIQNDTGSALVFLSFFLVLYREGLPGYILVSAVWLGILAIFRIISEATGISSFYGYGILLGLGSMIVFFVRKDRGIAMLVTTIAVISSLFYTIVGTFYSKILMQYQRDRIELVLGLKEDDRGMGFNLKQSKIAIGAGEMWGRGYLKGTQTQMGFVPDQHTDFIFDAIGEEWGFVGSTLFLLIFCGLLVRLVIMAERQSTVFGRVLGYSLASVLFFHMSINIGMTVGLVPTIGIPLPFISAGGSSLWAFTLFLFTFLRVDQVRK